MIPGERLDPIPVIVGPRREHLFGDGRNSRDPVEKVDHLFGARKPRQVAMNDDPVKTVVHKQEQVLKEACE